jgi:hypothetical protein
MTRVAKGYSLYLANSALYGKTLELKSSILAQLVTLADTTPGVTGYAVEDHAFEYQDSKGNQKLAKLPLAVKFDARTEYWDSVCFGSSEKPSLGNKAIAAHAKQLGFGYDLFDIKRLNRNLIEKKNRQSAQSLLYRAYGTDFTELETKCLLALVPADSSVQVLARLLGISDTKMFVVALRLWLAKRVRLPVTTQYLSSSWNIGRLNHAGL